jgi:hypothetical protein
MVANRQPTVTELNGVRQDTIHWPAKGHRVTQVNSDGNEITNIIKKYDTTDDTVIYEGIAKPDSLSGESVWSISKAVINCPEIDILLAGGNTKKTKKWDDRATLIYS